MDKEKGKGREGERDGRESLGGWGREGKGLGKRGGRENFGGPGPPNVFS